MEDQPNTKKSSRRLRNIKNTQRWYAGLAVLLFVVAVAAVFKFTSSDTPPKVSAAAPIAVVNITKDGFEPSVISVKQGTKVVWTNTDDALHQIVANPYPVGTDLPGLKSEILNGAQTYTYVANSAGTFGYHDQLIPTKNGTLVVQQ